VSLSAPQFIAKSFTDESLTKDGCIMHGANTLLRRHGEYTNKLKRHIFTDLSAMAA